MVGNFFHSVCKKKDREVSQPQVAFNYDVPTFMMVVNVIYRKLTTV